MKQLPMRIFEALGVIIEDACKPGGFPPPDEALVHELEVEYKGRKWTMTTETVEDG